MLGFTYSAVPYLGRDVGTAYSTPQGVTLSPAGRVVAYVRSTGPNTEDPQHVHDNLRLSVESAAALAIAGRQDIIVVLDGHVETITAAAAWTTLPADTIVVGAMNNLDSDNAPLINFTTSTAAQIVLSATGIQLRNLVFDVTGIDAVAAAINPDAAGCRISNCRFIHNDAAGQPVTCVLIDNVAADRFTFEGNSVQGPAADPATAATIVVSAAVDGLRIVNNTFIAGADATDGFINITAAALQFLIANNVFFNLTAVSTACIVLGNVATQGLIAGNRLGHNSGTQGTTGITLGAANIARLIENYHISEDDLSGVLTPVAT